MQNTETPTQLLADSLERAVRAQSEVGPDLPVTNKHFYNVTTAATTVAWDRPESQAALTTLFAERNIILLGGMGTGKTKATLAQCQGQAVLYVVPSITLAQNLNQYLPDSLYGADVHHVGADGRAYNKGGYGSYNVISCTPSLHKLPGMSFDTVVIDETRGTLRQLHQSTLLDGKREMAIACLDKFVETARKHVVVVDANMTEATVGLLPVETWHIGRCSATPLTFPVGLYTGECRAAVQQIIADTKASDLATWVAIDKLAFGDELAASAELNGVRPLVLTAETKNDREQAAFLRNPAAVMAGPNAPKLVIATSVIGSGYSIEGDAAAAFGSVGAIFTCSSGQTPDDYAQALCRVRSNVDRFLWSAQRVRSGMYGMAAADCADEKLAEVVTEKRHEQGDAKAYLSSYLLNQGCTIEAIAATATVPLAKAGEVKRVRRARISNALELHPAEAAEINRSRHRTSTQNDSLMRYTWTNRLGRDLTAAEWDIALGSNFNNKLQFGYWLCNLEEAGIAASPGEGVLPVSLNARRVAEAMQYSDIRTAIAPLVGLLRGEHQDASGEGVVWADFEANLDRLVLVFGAKGKTMQRVLAWFIAKCGLSRSRKKRTDGTYAMSLNMTHFALWQGLCQAAKGIVAKVVEVARAARSWFMLMASSAGKIVSKYEFDRETDSHVQPENPESVYSEHDCYREVMQQRSAEEAAKRVFAEQQRAEEVAQQYASLAKFKAEQRVKRGPISQELVDAGLSNVSYQREHLAHAMVHRPDDNEALRLQRKAVAKELWAYRALKHELAHAEQYDVQAAIVLIEPVVLVEAVPVQAVDTQRGTAIAADPVEFYEREIAEAKVALRQSMERQAALESAPFNNPEAIAAENEVGMSHSRIIRKAKKELARIE